MHVLEVRRNEEDQSTEVQRRQEENRREIYRKGDHVGLSEGRLGEVCKFILFFNACRGKDM